MRRRSCSARALGTDGRYPRQAPRRTAGVVVEEIRTGVHEPGPVPGGGRQQTCLKPSKRLFICRRLALELLNGLPVLQLRLHEVEIVPRWTLASAEQIQVRAHYRSAWHHRPVTRVVLGERLPDSQGVQDAERDGEFCTTLHGFLTPSRFVRPPGGYTAA